MESAYTQIELLKNLLDYDKDSISNGMESSGMTMNEEGYEPPPQALSVGQLMKHVPTSAENKPKTKKKVVDKNAIWEDEEVPEVTIPLTFLEQDTRERPQYEILYKQKVGSHDVYLGLDFEKDPSTSAADSLTVKIHLPKETNTEEANLDITSYSLALTSSN